MSPLTRARPAAFVLGATLLAAAVTHGPPAPSRPRTGGTTLSAAQAETAALAARTVMAEQAQQVRQVQQTVQARRAAAARRALKAAGARRERKTVVATATPTPPPRRAAPPVRVVRSVAPTAPRTDSAAQRGARVLGSLRYPWQRLGYRVQFLPAKQGYLGLTDFDQKLVQIYVRGSESDLVLAHSIAHELGHVLDFTRGSAATRAAYLSTRGLSRSPEWFGCSGCTDYRTPAGDWAEVFAYWLAGPGDFRSQLSGPPSVIQLSGLRAVFSI